MQIHLKGDLFDEVVPMHKDGIITILLFSKYANPLFAQREANGKLRLLVDLRKINTLCADDSTNSIHPASTLSDGAHCFAGKSLLQAWLLPVLSLFADGTLTVSGKTRIHFR